MKVGQVCEHGQLARNCERCEMKARIEELEVGQVCFGEFNAEKDDYIKSLRSRVVDLLSSTKTNAIRIRQLEKDNERLARYDDLLTKEMNPDFKDWHENSREEWPEMAAWVISNLRERLEEAEKESS